ncbi:hypothetical protein BDP81DRAFT_172967 [Colletotrichum phormii]|uniref:MYND-type zinc finger protein samB n=1 Tax=Colletotrichum phormii TaxID=359342 RepID=A0AAJ0E9F5_9PEZI|nr:uncharacterized protein BDP81DRAFT_172967 [Colletotrichum phormii]KAK1621693.1 hypothetical protein BDP81DRAFT_172967 [Colletotrichum phormii]
MSLFVLSHVCGRESERRKLPTVAAAPSPVHTGKWRCMTCKEPTFSRHCGDCQSNWFCSTKCQREKAHNIDAANYMALCPAKHKRLDTHHYLAESLRAGTCEPPTDPQTREDFGFDLCRYGNKQEERLLWATYKCLGCFFGLDSVVI